MDDIYRSGKMDNVHRCKAKQNLGLKMIQCPHPELEQNPTIQIVDVNRILNKSFKIENKPKVKIQLPNTNETITMVDINKILQGTVSPEVSPQRKTGVEQQPTSEVYTQIFSPQLANFNNIINKRLQRLVVPHGCHLQKANIKPTQEGQVQIIDINNILNQKQNLHNNIAISNSVQAKNDYEGVVYCGAEYSNNSAINKLPTLIRASENLYLIPIAEYRELIMPTSKNNDIPMVSDMKEMPVQQESQMLESTPLLLSPISKSSPPLSNLQKLEASRPAAYRCLNFKKRNYKVDLEGFTYFERCGFFKAEYSRAKRCNNILNMFVKTYENSVERLKVRLRSYENVKPEIVRNLMVKDYLPKETKSRLVYNFQKVRNPKLPQVIKNNLVVSNSQIVRNPIAKLMVNNKKNLVLYKSPECKQKVLSKLKLSLPFESLTEDDLRKRRLRSTTIFIDDDNLKIIANFSKKGFFRRRHVYFVNSNTVQTCLYMDSFPMFRDAVYSGRVNIIDKELLQYCMRKRKNKLYVSLPVTPTKSIIDDNVRKFLFSQYVQNFHAMFESTENTIQLEHSYSSNL